MSFRLCEEHNIALTEGTGFYIFYPVSIVGQKWCQECKENRQKTYSACGSIRCIDLHVRGSDECKYCRLAVNSANPVDPKPP